MSEKEMSFEDITFPKLLGLSFIVLKLCSIIDWNWLLILLPIYFDKIPDMIIFLIKKYRFLINVFKELFLKKTNI